MTDQPTSVFAESVQITTNAIEHRLGDRARSVLVCSPGPKQGKTMLAINLARAFACRGRNVLLVDANLRKPDASKILDALDREGLANALAERTDPLQLVTRSEGFDLLPAGSSPVPPVELVSRPEAAAFLRRAEQGYDVVIVDGPPVLGFSDTVALAKQVGTAVMVAKAGASTRESVREAAESLGDVGVETLGVVVNFVKPGALKHLAHDKYRPSTRGRRRLRLGITLPRLRRIRIRRTAREATASLTTGLPR